MVGPLRDILKNRYRIEGLIGRGGMAEVYRAWDTRRQHTVAIKMMREDLAEDSEFLGRFQREARALAALSHANVVRFYSFERDGPLAFIVMDYVEGTTLRRRILEASGAPLPMDEVVSVTRQVCAALHYAHQENVLHRDVKPGNIMICADGSALVADFGIAKAADAATVTTVMPGTPAYMSPEQCRSEAVDARTDVYSLGIVVYEMLAGRRPFVGETTEVETGSTREKIRWEQMHAQPPPLADFNPAVLPQVEQVVRRALAKRLEDRWPTVLGFWRAMERALGEEAHIPASTAEIRPVVVPGTPAAQVPAIALARVEQCPAPAHPPSTPAVPADPLRGRRSLGAVWIVGALVVVAASIVALSALGPSSNATATPQVIVRVVTGTAPAQPGATQPAPAPVFTPTGTPTHTRSPTPSFTPTGTATPTPTPSATPTHTAAPSWWTSARFNLMVHATQARNNTGLKVLRGQRVIVEYLGGSWRAGPSPTWPLVGPEGDRQVRSKHTFPVANAQLMSLVAGIDDDSPFLVGERIDFESTAAGNLWLGANDDQFADNDGQILVGITVLSLSGSAPAPPPSSQIVFTCFIDGFDEVCTIGTDGRNERRLTHTGATDWYASFSPDGGQIIFSSRREGNFEIYLMEANGSDQRRLTANMGGLYAPEISPDGRRVAFTSAQAGNQNVWVMDIDGRGANNLTNTTLNNVDPTWSPDGSRIAFSSDRTGDRMHYLMRDDGSQIQLLSTGLDEVGGRSDWSPDGRWLAFYAGTRDDRDLYMVGVNTLQLLRLTSGGNNVSPSFSPDGNWVVFASKRDGDLEIFIMQVDGTGVTQITYNDRPDWQPRWGP